MSGCENNIIYGDGEADGPGAERSQGRVRCLRPRFYRSDRLERLEEGG